MKPLRLLSVFFLILITLTLFGSCAVNPVTGQLSFWAEIENPDLQLRPGVRASLTIHDKPAETD